MLVLAGTVRTTTCLGVGIGTWPAELLLLAAEHLEAESQHHQRYHHHGNAEYYEYSLHRHRNATY